MAAIDINALMELAAASRASDIFIKEGVRPSLRVHGHVQSTDFPVVDAEEARRLAYSLMRPEAIPQFEKNMELDLAFTRAGLCRFRGSIYLQRGSVAFVLRLIPLDMPTLDDLGLPPVLKELPKQRQGLILVTGPTGCGKSTTLAAMIDQVNQSRRANIVTVEEPIEYVHPDKSCLVSQREVGIDTVSFTEALRHVLRQAPDVILIGEMRDTETMNICLQASETGHLVFSTVHTPSAYETMDRIINMFPPHDKPQISLRLANSLRAIVSQKLVPRADGTGRVAAVEVMIATPTIAKLIEEMKFGQIYNAIGEGNYWGMQTMNQCLIRYYRAGLITEEDALGYAGNITELRQTIRRPG
jgi:twitching motility protein PilT